MSKILHLDRSVDLYLSMTWNIKGQNHGICGHIYELIDYYLLLDEFFDVRILLCEDINWGILLAAITDKYDLSEDIINKIKSHTIFYDRPERLEGKNILFVDGGLKRSLYNRGIQLAFDNLLSFKCSKFDTFYDIDYKNLTALQDTRVYNDDDYLTAVEYKKKINFDRYKPLADIKTNTALIYITKNCRLISDVDLFKITHKYKFDRYIILTSSPYTYTKKFSHLKRFSFPQMPVANIFSKFDTYIYTPTRSDLKFDCSPRFIAECKFYNKDVIYHDIDDDYLEEDTGLKWRRYDVENDFDSICLKRNDHIVDVVRSLK